MKNLIIRTLSAIVIVVAMLEGTASENAWYYILWGVVGLGGIIELFSLLHNHKPDPKTMKPSHRTMWGVGGLIYILLATTLVMLMHNEWQMVIVLLTIVWANDAGAYLVGMAIGKHSMAPKISPKKSWEGFFGGLIFAVAISVAWWLFYFQPIESLEVGVENPSSIMVWIGLGIVVGLAAVGGDLLESKFKRTLGVKDSGKLIPGHGGMLDRFDALYLAIPIFFIYCTLLKLI